MSVTLILEKKPCGKDGCALYGTVHPRCKAHARSGNPCTMWPMKGQAVCKMHGGKSRGAREKALKTQALAEIATHAARLTAYDPEYAESPADGLMREMRWSAQVALALGELVAALQDETLVAYSAQGMRLNTYVEMWNAERSQHAKLCALALQAGIQQKALDLIESQATQIVNAMVSLLTSPRLNLSSEQIIEGRVVAAEVLRSLPSE